MNIQDVGVPRPLISESALPVKNPVSKETPQEDSYQPIPYSSDLAPETRFEDKVAGYVQSMPFQKRNHEGNDDFSELENLVRPILSRRYADHKSMQIVELGPMVTTTIPEIFKGGGNTYTAIDISPACLKKQREFLTEEGLIADNERINGDTYALPLKSDSVDLLVASSHTPFYSGTPAARMLAMDQCASVLKRGGELVLTPYNLEAQPPEVTSHLLQLFDLVSIEKLYPNDDKERVLLILRKK